VSCFPIGTATETSGTPSFSGDGTSKPCQWMVCESVRSGRWTSPRLVSVIFMSSFWRKSRVGADIWVCPLYVATRWDTDWSGSDVTSRNPKMYSGSSSRFGMVAYPSVATSDSVVVAAEAGRTPRPSPPTTPPATVVTRAPAPAALRKSRRLGPCLSRPLIPPWRWSIPDLLGGILQRLAVLLERRQQRHYRSWQLVRTEIPWGPDPDGPLLWPVLAVVVAATGGVGRRLQTGRRADAAVRGRARRERVRRRRERRAGAAHTAVDGRRRRLQVVVTTEPDGRVLARDRDRGRLRVEPRPGHGQFQDERRHEERVLADAVALAAGNRPLHPVGPEDLAVGQRRVTRREGVRVVRRAADLEVDKSLVDQGRSRAELAQGHRVVVPEDVVEQRRGVGEVGCTGGQGGLEHRLVRLSRQAGRMRHADGGVLRRRGGDVVGHRVVDDPHVRGVIEHDRPAKVGGPVVHDHVVADIDRLAERVGDEDAAAVITGEVALDQVAIDLHRSGAVAGTGGQGRAGARAVGTDRHLRLDRYPGARVDGVVVVDLVIVNRAAGAQAQVRDAGPVLHAEVRAEDAACDVVVVGAVEDPDAAGAGQPAVAHDAVVRHPDVVVVAAVRVRLAEADAAGEDATVVLEDVVGDLHVVDVCLQLDTAGAVTAAGLKAKAVDAGAVERGAVAAGGRGGHVVRRDGLGDGCDVGATHDRRERRVGDVRRVRGHGGVVGCGVLREEAAVDLRADDVEPWVLGGTRIELVGPDEATRTQTLDLQRLPQQDVLVVDTRRQDDQAARCGPVVRVLQRVRVGSRRWRWRHVHDRRVVTDRIPASPVGAQHVDGDAVDAGIAAV